MIENMKQELIKLESSGFENIYVPTQRLRMLMNMIEAAEELAKDSETVLELAETWTSGMSELQRAVEAYRAAGGGDE